MEENKRKMPLAHVSLEYKLKETPIDYFHLSPDLINVDEQIYVHDKNVIDLNLKSDEYLNAEHLNIDHSLKETIVLNLPVGKGKTQVCYDLIRKYHADGYYVFVCSPFIKLIEKDLRELGKHLEPHEVFTYLNIEKKSSDYRQSLTWGVEARVIIMSINFLLQNPGESSYEQAFTKRDYLSYLKDIISSENKKIVFFFDEIHDAVKNFGREYLPNLFKWVKLTHKCYVSSATFTPASIPVIRYIATLTDLSIKIYNTPRLKAPAQANLHLHISTESYNSNFLYPLGKIAKLIEGYKGRKINILSGYESIVAALIRTNNQSLNFRLLENYSQMYALLKTEWNLMKTIITLEQHLKQVLILLMTKEF